MHFVAPLCVHLSLTIACVFLPALAHAQEPQTPSKTRWTAKVGTGVEYDTNVTVDEVDLSSGQSDYAWVADFKLGMQRDLGENTRASANYNISSSRYNEFSRVNRLTQIAGADINHDLGKSNLALSTYFIDSKLDGEDFLRYVRVSPSLSGFFSKRWFARGAYVFSEREIDQRADRDATTHTGELDFYYFHRGLRSYLNIGYRYRDEDAIANELDFTSHSFKIRYIRRFDLWSKKAKAEFAMRYEERDYLSPEPTIDTKRNDDRIRWKLDFEVPLTQRLTWSAYYSYGDYVSNLPRADFTQTIVGSRLQLAW